MICPNCKKELKNVDTSTVDLCWFCGHPLKEGPQRQVQIASQPIAARSTIVMARYKDAYRIYRAVSGTGRVIKGIGVFLAILLVASGFIGSFEPRIGPSAFISGAFSAAIVWVACWVAGTLVVCVAQIQLAALDSAVYASTFLTNDERAEIMTLPAAQAVIANG